jgi:hypothetical protein
MEQAGDHTLGDLLGERGPNAMRDPLERPLLHLCPQSRPI